MRPAGFESAMLNEFVGRQFPCDQLVPVGPTYADVPTNATTCAVKGSRPGENFVDGAEYLRVAFGFVDSHKWRNFGILVAFTIGLCAAHLYVSEVVAAARSKGEVLVFKRGALKKQDRKAGTDEEDQAAGKRKSMEKEDGAVESNVAKQTSVLHWKNVSYTVKSGGEERTILDNVDGWVKPGSLTALMGVSGVSSCVCHMTRSVLANVDIGRQDHVTRCARKSCHYGGCDRGHAS
jgi:ATP-binding cassette subfamily G (WHITE) protein 2 (PDR)